MYRILAVDDEPAVLGDLRYLVDWESIGTELAACVTSAADALELLGRDRIDILITDVRMPRMDGLVLIARAREVNPSLRCIVVSAYDDFRYVRDALRLGVENYLLKPINSGELAETLIRVVSGLDEAGRPADERAFRTNILDRWVSGSIQDFELLERAALLGIDLNQREFAVVVADAADPAPPEAELARAVALAEAFRGLLGGALGAECFVDGRGRAVAVLRGPDLADRREEIHALLRREVEAMAGACVVAAVGPRVQSAFAVSASYRSAGLLLEYRHLRGDRRVLFADELPDLATVPPPSSSLDVIHFRQALEDLDEEEAARIAGARIVRAPHGGDAFREALPLLLHLAQWLGEHAARGGPVALTVGRLRSLAQIEGAEPLLAALTLLIQEGTRLVRGARTSVHPLVRQVLETVHRSFREPLSLKTLAARFAVNPSYLGQLLHTYTGRLFHELLNDVRMREARTLLLATDLRISEIAERTGVPQQSYFNRVFRKSFDMTPLEYRRLYGATEPGQDRPHAAHQ